LELDFSVFFHENALNKFLFKALLREPNEMDSSLVALLISVLLAILASFLGAKYYYVKGKVYQFNALISGSRKPGKTTP
jgi:hypothetical protein